MCKGPGVGVFSLEPSEGRTVREEAREVMARSRDWVGHNKGFSFIQVQRGALEGLGQMSE